MNDTDIVKIGKKNLEDYLGACFFSLNRNGAVTVKGLGRWNGKVISVVRELNASRSIETVGPEFFKVDGTHGIKYQVYMEDDENGIEIGKEKR